jgi:hypothetical protein
MNELTGFDQFSMTFLWKESLNSDGQQFHQMSTKTKKHLLSELNKRGDLFLIRLLSYLPIKSTLIGELNGY